MTRLVSVAIYPDGSESMHCSGGAASVRLCGCEVGCANLPPRIKLTISGDAMWRMLITDRANGGTDEHRVDVSIPPSTITLDRNGTSNTYSTEVSCPLPISGRARRTGDALTIDTGITAIDTIYVTAVQSDPLDPASPCVLGAVALRVKHTGDSPLDGLLVAHYDTLGSPLVGTHSVWGGSPTGTHLIVADADVDAVTPTVRDPSVWEDVDPLGGRDRLYESWSSPWEVTIEAHAGAPICDPLPIVYATKCIDETQRITVDLVDALPNEPSLPIYNGDLYQPTRDPSTDPVDTHTWVAGTCADAIEYGVYALCGDDTTRILIDETGKPDDAVTLLIGLHRYRPVGELETGTPDPRSITWSTDPCPGVGEVWELCSGGGYTGGPPPRVRCEREDLNTMLAYIWRWTTESSGVYCSGIDVVYYRLIADDGGDYPQIDSVVQSELECDDVDHYRVSRVCYRIGPDGEIDPIDPTLPASLRLAMRGLTDAGDPEPTQRVARSLPTQRIPEGWDSSMVGREGSCCSPPEGV